MLFRVPLMLICAALVAKPETRSDEAAPSPTAALQRLKEGNARFVADRPDRKNVGAARREELANGQHPFVVVLSCADSRVVPETLFDQGLGDLFVVRVAGNVAEPGAVGSIVYAVTHLRAPLIVVLGHEKCGAVEAALSGKPLAGDLGWLIRHVHTGKQTTLDAAIDENVLYQTAELVRRSQEIKELAESQRIQIVPAVYELASGKVRWLKAKDAQKP
jgi:carbonic anhydrase